LIQFRIAVPFNDLGRARQLSGLQGVIDGLFDQMVPLEPLAGLQVQFRNRVRRYHLLELTWQKLLKKVVIAKPFFLCIK